MIPEDIELTLIPHLSPAMLARLVECFGSAEAIFAAPREELMGIAKIPLNAIDNILARSMREDALREAQACSKRSIRPIAATDAEYPPSLWVCADRPHVIYTVGRVDLLRREVVTMVGTRRSSSYGQRAAAMLVDALAINASQVAIASGLAYGIDSAVHRAAMEAHIPTICVMPSALPTITPSSQVSLAREIVRSGGLVMSEANSHSKQAGRNYQARNRILAGLGAATVVVESAKSGGSLMTAAKARGYGRTVGAVVGRITDSKSEGCNDLIAAELARPITSVDELYKILDWQRRAEVDKPAAQDPLEGLSPSERAVALCFKDRERLSLGELIELSGLGYSEMSVILLALELRGLVQDVRGNMYEREFEI
ncbi:MAG: DNA-processing protein DprA [Rikenellaceae bacterium]